LSFILVSQRSSKTGLAAVIIAFCWTFFTVAPPTSCLPSRAVSDSTTHAAFRIYCPFINYKVHFVGFKNDFTKLLNNKTLETYLLSTHKAVDTGQIMISSVANRAKS